MSLVPRICFACQAETYNLDGHRQQCHKQCGACSAWNKDPASKTCHKCRAPMISLGTPGSAESSNQSPTASAVAHSSKASGARDFRTVKCRAHRGVTLTRHEIQACPHCRCHPLLGGAFAWRPRHG